MPSEQSNNELSNYEQLNGIPTETPLENAVSLPYSRIRPNPDQPRKHFDETAMAELADSIRAHGIQQPLTVRYEPSRYDGTPYILVAGERRFRASEGILEMLPCIILNVDAVVASELALIENIQREDLTALEEAHKLRELMTGQNLSISKVAKRLSVSQGWVTNRIALLKTGDDVQQVAAVKPKAMSSLLVVERVKEPELRAELLAEVLDDAPVATIKARVEAHESAMEAQKRAQTIAGRAPDTETQSRLAANEKGEASGMSRGKRVTGVSTREADAEVERALGNLEAWLPRASDRVKEKAEKMAQRIVRADGDLARKRYV